MREVEADLKLLLNKKTTQQMSNIIKREKKVEIKVM